MSRSWWKYYFKNIFICFWLVFWWINSTTMTYFQLCSFCTNNSVLCFVVAQHSKTHWQTSNCISVNAYSIDFQLYICKCVLVAWLFSPKCSTSLSATTVQLRADELLPVKRVWFAHQIVGQHACIRKLNTCCLTSRLLLLSQEASLNSCNNIFCHIPQLLTKLGQPAVYML